ncbi:unnamed protein product, partial [Ectocarpus sp. 4 AP-2014]
MLAPPSSVLALHALVHRWYNAPRVTVDWWPKRLKVQRNMASNAHQATAVFVLGCNHLGVTKHTVHRSCWKAWRRTRVYSHRKVIRGVRGILRVQGFYHVGQSISASTSNVQHLRDRCRPVVHLLSLHTCKRTRYLFARNTVSSVLERHAWSQQQPSVSLNELNTAFLIASAQKNSPSSNPAAGIPLPTATISVFFFSFWWRV